RHRAWADRRLVWRLDRRPDYADHGYFFRHSRPDVPHRLGDDFRAKPGQHLSGAGPDLMAEQRAYDARAGFEREGSGLCPFGACARRVDAAYSVHPYSAQCDWTHGRTGVAGRGRRHPERIDPEFPRPWHPDSDAKLGRDGEYGQSLHDHRVVVFGLPRIGHYADGAWIQLPGRRAARRAAAIA